jgi:mono/diheme cytochrome c family protein
MRTRLWSIRSFAAGTLISLAACGGGEKAPAADSASATPAAAPTADSTAPAAAPATTTASAAMAAGEQVFARCVVCHQATGQGLPGAFPPLAGSEWVNGKVDVPIAIVMHGLQGPITVGGNPYNSMMMAYGTGAVMTDEEIANVLTYVRGSWGNNASAVTVEDVARVKAATASRKAPYTAAELEALK